MPPRGAVERKLSTYRAKRDFARTDEPSGEQGIRAAEYPRFVIQKHDASRLHYDLRLEVDGVLKSWAVTKGPSLNPNEKRLAVEVEDHPLEYGDFEGTIPKGQYGGGTVMLWDRGFWVPVGEKSPAQALREGELKFLLAGDKLRGEWVLVRMKARDGGDRNNWLLIKHRDSHAKAEDQDILSSEVRSVASGRTMEQIAAGKGRAPTPFIIASRMATKPDAVWFSNAVRGAPKASTSGASGRAETREGRKMAGTALKHRAETRSSVLGIAISSPDKVLWPETKGTPITKLGLARYLATVGSWMIAYVRGRPCSVIRAPEGITGDTFYQRHAGPGTPEFVHQVRIAGEAKPYLRIDTVEGLVAMAQMAAVEFHPWNSAPHDLQTPGRLVFDLDPAPDVPFGAVVAAAKELRVRLKTLGLVAFCKTTGGKGLHVVTPIKTDSRERVSWDQAKVFAQTVCAQMAHDSPERFVTKMTKKLRTGRIYLDYLRNDYMATAVAPLSPRARPGATVSMPLTWGQVREGLDPKRFTIHTVPSIIAKSAAWKEYCESERSLRAAIKRLVK